MAYDPETDVDLYGIGSVEFPTTLYDRPKLMLANLVRGDVDALTRSMLAPDTLTPREAQTLTNKLLGKKPNKFLKTITDVATNPLVIAGLALSFWKYPVGTSTKYLAKMGAGLSEKAPVMNRSMDWLHGALTGLRGYVVKLQGKKHGLYDLFTNITTDQTKFVDEYSTKLSNIFETYAKTHGKLSADDLITVGAVADRRGMEFLVKKGFQANKAGMEYWPEVGKWLRTHGYKQGDDLLRGLNVSPKGKSLTKLGNEVADWHKQIWKRFPATPKEKAKMLKHITMRGDRAAAEFGKELQGYGLSHFVEMDRYTKLALGNMMNRMTYQQWLAEAYPRIANPLKVAQGGSIPLAGHILSLEKSGFIPGGLNQALSRDLASHSAEVTGAIRGLWDDALAYARDDATEMVNHFHNKFIKYFKHGPGKKYGLEAKLGGKAKVFDKGLQKWVKPKGINPEASMTIRNMGNALADARFDPKKLEAELREIGHVLGQPARYSLHGIDSPRRYLASMSSSYPWVGTQSGQMLTDAVTKLKGSGQLKAHTLDRIQNELIPHYKGYKPYQQLQRSLAWGEYKQRMHTWLTHHPVALSVEKRNPKFMQMARDYFSENVGSMTAEGAGAQISQFFYLSTLGANISPASKNLLQNVITAMMMPGVGPQGMGRGLKTLWPRLMGGTADVWDDAAGAFKKVRFEKGFLRSLKDPKAFAKHFPEYYDELGEADAMVTAMKAGDIASEGIGVPEIMSTKWGQVKKGLLMPFQTSEAFNRLAGFYAGQQSHLHWLAREGKKVTPELFRESIKAGRNLVHAAHFPGGPLGMPRLIQGWWSPWRQFMHFPLRYAGFLHSSMRWGPDAAKMDLGTIGRVAAGSAATYEVAKNLLGVDLSQGLMTGALPLPNYEGAPFHPFPLVSPAVGVMGSLAQAAYSGDPKNLGATASLVVPGGIAARRAYRTLAPKYADYQNRTPEGRIPVYNDSHSLIGTFTPMQMFLRTMGIKPKNIAQEQGAAKWILAQRDKIRGIRRDYLQALYENDHSKARKIQGEFQKAYPELGELQVKKSDITALRNRREISRLNRIMKGMPKAYRPLFNQAVGETALATMTRDLELDPGKFDIYFPQQ